MSQYRVGKFAAPAQEVSRLQAQAELVAAEERRALIDVGLPTHGRGIEVGCGPGFFAAELARASPKLDLLGLDVDPYVVAEARQRLRVIRADANNLPLAARSFDFAYSRLFLRHVSDPAAVLAGMTRIVKPGGRIAAIDLSDSSLLLDPLPPDFAAIVAARREWFDRRGGNADMGHKLPGLFVRSGLEDVRVKIVRYDTTAGGAKAFSDIVLVAFLQAAQSVLPDSARWQAAAAAIERWTADPAAFGVISFFVVSGRRGETSRV
jgi:SAM-dependent methyltransferase